MESRHATPSCHLFGILHKNLKVLAKLLGSTRFRVPVANALIPITPPSPLAACPLVPFSVLFGAGGRPMFPCATCTTLTTFYFGLGAWGGGVGELAFRCDLGCRRVQDHRTVGAQPCGYPYGYSAWGWGWELGGDSILASILALAPIAYLY
eukprot:scaffold109113_cov31-Tisochrysis_lutea.AAC.3